MTARVLLLASGSGSVLQALLDSDVGSAIIAVGSDRPQAVALERGRRAGVDTFVVDFAGFRERADWSRALLDAMERLQPTLVVLAGFMRILDPLVVQAFRGRIINTHPALLPSFPGTHAIRDALAAGVRVTGCTVHWVDEGVDTGPIIDQAAVRVMDDDDEDTLHERVKAVERELLVSVVTRLVGQSPNPQVGSDGKGRVDGG